MAREKDLPVLCGLGRAHCAGDEAGRSRRAAAARDALGADGGGNPPRADRPDRREHQRAPLRGGHLRARRSAPTCTAAASVPSWCSRAATDARPRPRDARRGDQPAYLSADDVPADQVEKEREIIVAQAAADPKLQGKPKEVLVKASEGKLRKFLGEITLLGQPFVKDDKQVVGDVLKRANAKSPAFRALRSRRRHREEAGRLRRRGDGPGPGSLTPDRSRRLNRNPARAGFLIMAPRRR